MLRQVLKIIAGILLSVAALFLAILIYLGVAANDMADLKDWHEVPQWKDDITQAEHKDFAAYLEAEKTLLDSIYASVQVKVKDKGITPYNKYDSTSSSSPMKKGENLNASFELLPKDQAIHGGILLVHGLTDSPYHFRAIGQIFADNGFYVIGLRLPGHGTVPGALLDVSWQDWYEAVQFGADMVRKKNSGIPDSKFYLGGFSTGGALTLRYTLDAVMNNKLHAPDKLLLLSPAIGVDPLAEVTDWHNIISWMDYFEKFKWLDIIPEYDPFKYNSFAKNAGDQIFDLTQANWDLIDEFAGNSAHLEKLPPIYTFQSIVDATVKTPKLIEMYNKIASKESELVLFDVNRKFNILIKTTVKNKALQLEELRKLKANVILVTNEKNENSAGYNSKVMIKSLPQTSTAKPEAIRQNINPASLEWPENVFALSHVSIPIAPSDSVYGRSYMLGKINVKGEHKVLVIGNDLTRLRHNPFFDLIKTRLEVSFMELSHQQISEK